MSDTEPTDVQFSPFRSPGQQQERELARIASDSPVRIKRRCLMRSPRRDHGRSS